MEPLYEWATLQACTTDCLAYRQGTCPFRYDRKLECSRVRVIYERAEESGMEVQVFPVSYAIRDAWAVSPPCESSTPYCHRDCPYFGDCGMTENLGEDEDFTESIE